jgi:predicted NUDIX family phosphoesterase
MEFVYVVKRGELFERRFPHGLEVLDAAAMADVLSRIRTRGFFVERRHAETDATMKQIIPYCVVARGGDVFLTRRTQKGGDARLFGKRSIGIGGHVNPVDGASVVGADVLALGLRREVEEELEIDGAWTVHAVGFLNDDSTDVGSVHFGLVHVVRVEGDVRVRETDNLVGGFTPAADLARLCRDERATFETWSALLVDRLDDVLTTRS